MIKLKYVNREKLFEICKDKRRSGSIKLFDNSLRLGDYQYKSKTSFPEKIVVTPYTSGTEFRILENVCAYVLLGVLNENSGRQALLFLPDDVINEEEVEEISDWAEEVLNEIMPGNWFITEGRLHLHYPELTINNSIGMSHTIYNLVVTVRFNDMNLGIYPELWGTRVSLTSNEIRKNYFHSHIRNNGSKFCLGGSSSFSKFLQSLSSVVTKQQFELFLFQLKAYLEWESLEGSPYISMQQLNAAEPEENLYSIPIPSSDSISAMLEVIVEEFMKLITPDQLSSVTDDYYIYDPGIIEEQALETELKVIEIMKSSYPGLDTRFYCKFNKHTSYVRDRNDEGTLTINNIPNPLNSRILNGLNITPRIIEDTKPTQEDLLIRLQPLVLREVIRTINEKLINKQNELRDSIKTDPQSYNNTEVSEPDSYITQ